MSRKTLVINRLPIRVGKEREPIAINQLVISCLKSPLTNMCIEREHYIIFKSYVSYVSLNMFRSP